MNKFLFIIGLMLSQISLISTAEPQNVLSKEIQQLIDSTNEDLNIGIEFRNINSKKTIYSLHNNRKFIPASTTKLFTAYAALHHLNGDFQYKTKLLTDASGNVYIKFSGDPTFTDQDLETILSHFKNKTIKGNIVIDGSIFDDKTSSRGGFTWDDTPFYYAAPTSAIIINDNCSQAQMFPNKRVHEKALLEIDKNQILHIENNVNTIKPSKKECPYKSRYLGENKYEVYGCMFNNMAKPVKLNFALPDNALMAKNYIETALHVLNIKLAGHVASGKTPQNAKILYEHKSTPLRDLLIPAMHSSHNLTFASLFKYIAHKHTGIQGSDEDCELAIHNILRSKGIDNNLRIKDGSGESKYNLISPKTMVSLLEDSYHSHIRQDFINILPQYGAAKSTLRNRSILPNLSPYIYAKTGGLEGISSLVGYYLPPDDNKTAYAFAIMINNHTLPAYKAKELEDRILELLIISTQSRK
jgi:serine-type D-Ala-D-Ala carboxypeptidase/endopeptidase (penicillin-binding protein 4)